MGGYHYCYMWQFCARGLNYVGVQLRKRCAITLEITSDDVGLPMELDDDLDVT